MTTITSRRAVLDRKAYRKAFGKRLREARVGADRTGGGQSCRAQRCDLAAKTGNGHVTRPAMEFYSKYRVALREHHIDLDWLVAGDGQPLTLPH